MAYLLDTNVFVQAKNYHYGFAVCPGFWQWLDHAHKEKLAFSIEHVRTELLQKEDELARWSKDRKAMFVKTDDGLTYEAHNRLSTWVTTKYEPFAQAKFFGCADFDLVGYASGHNHIVVTHEVPSNGAEVKIPNACKAMGVQCVTPFEMLTKEKAKFVLELPRTVDLRLSNSN